MKRGIGRSAPGHRARGAGLYRRVGHGRRGRAGRRAAQGRSGGSADPAGGARRTLLSYTIRYSLQEVDSRYATSTSLDAVAETRFLVDNSALYVRFDAQFDPQWSMFVSLVGTEADGSTPFLGANFEAAVTQQQALAPFVQDGDDLEIGVRYQFADGPFVGASIRAFEYDDTFFPQTDYDGTIATFSAGFDF